MDFPDPNAQRGISPHNSPFDHFEFNNLQGPAYPHTPSYNGSYHNSPYSGHSELSFGGDGEQFALFDEEPAGLVIHEDYDPSEYDPPSSGGLLMFDSEFMSGNDTQVSVAPAQIGYSSPNAFDYSSPSSNGGGEEGQPRSRASSISSNPHKSSPRLDVTQGFEKMRFESPNWGTHALPAVDRSISPPTKPQSPPQLMIPGSPSGNIYPQSPPTINAPDGDGGLMGEGPQLHIVPATPVSGGGGPSQPVPFQTSLETLHQGKCIVDYLTSLPYSLFSVVIAGSSRGQQQTSSGWNQRSQQLQQSDVSGGGQYPDPAQLPFNFPGHSHSHNSDLQRLSSSNAQVHANSNTNFLYPNPPRSRSKSDTDLRPPQWANMSQDHLPNGDGSTFDDDNAPTVNLNDILPTPQHPSSAGTHQQSFGNLDSMQPPPMHFNFGPPSSTNNFLSPDMGAQLRRSKSDTTPRPGHQRLSRSEDMRHSSAMMYPDTSHQEFMHRQFLHPQEGLPYRGAGGSSHRRSSSDRGDGSWSNASSSRPSPYPSPSASPRYNQDELPNVALSGRQPHMLQHELQELPSLPARMDQSTVVSKPNVTTGRTANASRIRRKQEANFMCPVPGCGSTFTRSFNLKGACCLCVVTLDMLLTWIV